MELSDTGRIKLKASICAEEKNRPNDMEIRMHSHEAAGRNKLSKKSSNKKPRPFFHQ